LGDASEDHADTWAFLDRRIENVMQFEKAKAKARENKALTGLLAGPLRLLETVRAPQDHGGMPGRWRG
jgi:ubiquinone biosynthesis protein COQ9